MTSHQRLLERRLLEAVLDLDRDTYHRLYATNAEFHHAIATMVRVLPPLMRLIADDAIRNDQERDRAQSLLTEAFQHPLTVSWQEEARGPAPGWKPEPRQ